MKGCLIVVCSLFGLLLISGTVMSCISEKCGQIKQERIALELENTRKNEENKIKEEALAQQRSEKEKSDARKRSKEDRLRSFMLKEAPRTWEAYQTLQAEIETQNKRIKQLSEAMEDFGRQKECDEDYRQICASRDEMIRSVESIRSKMEDAYLQSLKYEALPSRGEQGNAISRALEEGASEAQATIERFKCPINTNKGGQRK